MLQVDTIHAYYGASHVLQGVSLRVSAGECVALLGRNGAGKTTTIHSIVGFVQPRAGRVLFNAEDLTHKPPYQIVRRGIGLVPQGRRIFPDLTVRENVMLAARSDRKSTRLNSSHSSISYAVSCLKKKQGRIG